MHILNKLERLHGTNYSNGSNHLIRLSQECLDHYLLIALGLVAFSWYNCVDSDDEPE